MTAVCGGGTSGPTMGANIVVRYTSGLLAAIFAAYDMSWLIPVIPLVGLSDIALDAFCATDPPAVPTFTQAEIDALLHLQFGADFDSGASKFRDWCQHAIWYDACHCTSGALVPVTPPAQPSGSTTVVYAPPGSSGPCDTFAWPAGSIDRTGNVNCQDTHTFDFRDVLNVSLMTKALPGTMGADYTYDVAVPVGARWLYLSTDSAGGCGNFARSGPSVVPGATMARFHIHNFYDAPANLTRRNPDVAFYCNGDQPGATQTSCCAPDPATQATLNTILDLVRSMQRNYAPFGYIEGGSHAGLTGTGSISVSRLVGVRVQITAYPGTNQVLPGNPVYVKDLGWMSVSDANGMIKERRVSQTAFVWLPEDCPLAESVKYDLFPGVTATITELEPEP